MARDIICGLHAVLAALQQGPRRIDDLWLNEDRNDKRSLAIVDAANGAGVKIKYVPNSELKRIAGTDRHQGAVCCCRAMPPLDGRGLEAFIGQLQQAPLLLILDGVQDPRNLGACLRCADGAGVHAVIVPRDRATSITAVVQRTASGAAESVPVFQVTNLSRVMRQLKKAGIWLVGAVAEADSELFSAKLTGPLGIVIGGEEKGLRRLTREHCDTVVRIPMHGAVASLNLSVAAAICLYEALRQRGTCNA